MPKLASVRGMHALVTGASSGIGRAMALRLAGEGARLSLVARRRELLEEVADEARAVGAEARVRVCDVADRPAAEPVAEEAVAGLGPDDLLVNNAGYGRHCRFVDHEVEDIERMLRVNTLGSIYLTKALLPAMLEARRGWIVFVASVAGKIASPDESVYAASKFAVVGLASALGLEVEEAGVHVLTVCPGVIRTPFFDDEALSRMPPVALRQMVEPEKLVDAIRKALAEGRHELTYPRGIAAGYAVQAFAPSFMRRQVKRNTIDAVAKRERRVPTDAVAKRERR